MCGSSSEETQGNTVEATTEVTEEAAVEEAKIEESEAEVDVETSEAQFNFEIVDTYPHAACLNTHLDVLAYDLLNNYVFKIPKVIPDGNYKNNS